MFNTDIAVEEFARLHRKYGFKTCFETGTRRGVGALGASEYCPIVATVEISYESRDLCIKKFLESGYTLAPSVFEGFDNKVFVKDERMIVSMLGSSPDAMRWYLERSDKDAPFCFYLDAHGPESSYWPIRDELKVIAEFKLSNSVVIVHDCRVPQDWEPGNGYGYDTYDGQDLCYEYLSDLLSQINPKYQIAFNHGGPRGILYALP